MSLEGRMIAISIGDAPDRGRLGYPQREVDRVLLSVCTALVRAGARIVYGGNLDPAGFTFKNLPSSVRGVCGSQVDPSLRARRAGARAPAGEFRRPCRNAERGAGDGRNEDRVRR